LPDNEVVVRVSGKENGNFSTVALPTRYVMTLRDRSHFDIVIR
jgi:hypothetical protein